MFSTPQAVLTLGAPGLGALSIAGASAAAPVLACDDEEPGEEPTDPAPTDDDGAGPTITLPPTDVATSTSTTATGAETLGIASLLLVVAVGGAAVSVRRRATR